VSNSYQKSSLIRRLYIVLILAALIVFAAFFIGAWWMETQSLESMLQKNGKSLSASLEQSIKLGVQLGDANFVRDGAAGLASMPDVLSIDIYDAGGKRITLLGQHHDVLSLQKLEAVHKNGLSYETISKERRERVITLVHGKHGEVVGYSVLDLSRAAVNDSIDSVLMLFASISLLLLLFFWGMLLLAIRQLQQPLDAMVEAVDAVAHGRLDVTVDAMAPDPLGRIARSFNRMTTALTREQHSLRIQTKEMERSERRFRELFTYLPVAMYMADLDGRLRKCNPAMVNLFGYSSSDEMLANAESMSKLYTDPQQRDMLIAELLRVQSLAGREVSFVSNRGDKLQCLLHARLVTDEDGLPKGVEGMIQDMTELRLLESNLQQAQKMELVGQLAGGVAHDFNNLLSVILGNAALLASNISHDDKSYQYANRIKQAGNRAAELTGNLLGFARKGDMRHEPVVIATLLEEVVDLISETRDRRVEIVLQMSRNDLRVNGDPGQLHQVFMNLAVNAMHAMPDGGELLFRMTSVRGFVLIQVKDSGIGMTKKTLKHIFEPFFTTRETGKGTGLGLSMVYGIIEKMGGKISVSSEPGQGTTFEVKLPLMDEADGLLTFSDTIELKHGEVSGSVLLVDDEALLREVGEEILKSCGFDVTTAASGEEALALLSSGSVQVDIVLLDLNMPGLGGVETLRKIRRNDEHMRVIVLSGYSETTLDSSCRELRYDGFITKPYQFNELCAEVSRILGI